MSAGQTVPGTDALEGEEALWRAFKTGGSQAAREKLFEMHAQLARGIASRHYRERTRGDLELADLYQHAFAGLLEALDRFDPGRQVPFRPFAAHRISGSILDGLAKTSEIREQISWRHRMRRERLRSLAERQNDDDGKLQPIEELAELALGLALGFILEDSGMMQDRDAERDPFRAANAAYESVAWNETVDQLRRELDRLPEREQTILRQHYEGGMDFDRLAALLSLSKGRVSQLHRAALTLLRKRLKERGHFRMIR